MRSLDYLITCVYYIEKYQSRFKKKEYYALISTMFICTNFLVVLLNYGLVVKEWFMYLN